MTGTWLKFGSRNQLAFAPNFTFAPRTATLNVAGSTLNITQEARSARSPLLVEPVNASGPRGIFRFTYTDGPLTAAFAESTIRFGDRCNGTVSRTGSFVFEPAASSGCSWNSVRVESNAALITVTLDVTFSARGVLPITADGRQLGIFTAANEPPIPPPPVQPPPPPVSNYSAIMLLTDHQEGPGGLFRFAFTQQPRSVWIRFAAFDTACAFLYDAPRNAFTLASDEFCVLNSQRSSAHTEAGFWKNGASDAWILDVYLQFRSTAAGPKSVTVQTLLASGQNTVPISAGSFIVTPAVDPPTAFALPGLLRVGLPSRVPIESARVKVGACTFTYTRLDVIAAIGECPAQLPTVRQYDNDLIFLIYNPPAITTFAAEQTPTGGIASGWLPQAP